MKLTCVRHTRVDISKGICYGLTDVGLADSYSEELFDVKNKLSFFDFDTIYSSPLYRCRKLANDLFPTETILFDDRLKELNFGQWELQEWAVISETPEAKLWFDDFVGVRCPGGESFQDQINRTASFLEDLAGQAFNDVLLVAHGGILRALDCLINGTEPINAFCNQFDYGQVVQFNL